MTTTIRAAIYARRSKEQDDAEDETKSVNRQVENARVFATAKGWTVLAPHIYVDDGISGSFGACPAERQSSDAPRDQRARRRRPSKCSFVRPSTGSADAMATRAFAELKMVAKAGVQVWFYSDGTCFQFGDFASEHLEFPEG